MLRIGLIGESPYDTSAVKNLLEQKYKGKVHFLEMRKNTEGNQLDNPRTANGLIVEYRNELPHHVIFIRDTDGLVTEKNKTKKVHDWFNRLNQHVDKKGILLCNIYELEALILADIETFNHQYKTNLKFPGNVTFKKDPKGYLKEKTSSLNKKYKENHCPELFKELRIETIIKKVPYFKKFIAEFEEITKLKPSKTA